MKIQKYSVYFLLLITLGCGSSLQIGEPSSKKSDSPIFDKPNTQLAEGSVNGQPWRALSGRARIDLHDSEPYLVVDLWAQKFEEPCTENRGSDLQVNVKTFAKEGSFSLGRDPFKLEPLIIFTDLNALVILRNYVANMGYVIIDQISKDTVQGRLQASFGSLEEQNSAVVGAFLVPLCGSN